MFSCECKILFKSEQICGCCCKMLRGSLFCDTRYRGIDVRRGANVGSRVYSAGFPRPISPIIRAHLSCPTLTHAAANIDHVRSPPACLASAACSCIGRCLSVGLLHGLCGLSAPARRRQIVFARPSQTSKHRPPSLLFSPSLSLRGILFLSVAQSNASVLEAAFFHA